MMKTFKKRPMDVQAERWIEGELPPEMVELDPLDGIHFVRTPEGRWSIKPGDWLVRGESGRHYVVPHPDFLKVYEPAET